MKIGFSPILLTVVTVICLGQSQKKEIYNKDFKWTISIPENFERVSAEDWEKMQNKGATAIENTYGQEIVNQAKTIFVFKSGQLNYFESNYQPFDERVDGDFLESCEAVIEVLNETFTSQMPGIKIEKKRMIERIDDLDFLTYHMEITYPNNMILHAFMYSRLFGKREFTVNIMYIDESLGQQMKAAWLKSKFAK